ncbi:hypothetical protein GCM10007898_11540 [Dyella flagellata]|uniref:Uncharacterized protein n=1 Tax=Dyella flagellata TaxID=1867833 RepID=A0ABQ5X7N5_9GAMM|nr:hypothetical protein GCM10007898_11540 [Dyella flagellata]
MHENIRAIVAADEAETLGIVEPFDGTDLTIRHVAHSKTQVFKQRDSTTARGSLLTGVLRKTQGVSDEADRDRLHRVT